MLWGRHLLLLHGIDYSNNVNLIGDFNTTYNAGGATRATCCYFDFDLEATKFLNVYELYNTA